MFLMETSRSPSSALTFLLVMLIAAGSVWWWRLQVADSNSLGEVQQERWEHVRERFPLLEGVPGGPTLNSDLVERFVNANPFSPQRRYVPAADGSGSGIGGEAVKPAGPSFIYKGQVHLGQRRRAILEDTTGHKTHFLEVGQAVAGYKVLDIFEDRVLLSDPQTNKEVAVFLSSKEKPGATKPAGQAP
jgi:hypothetical protein